MSGKDNEGVNVQVLLRCRPLSAQEIADRTPPVVSCNETLREVTLYQFAAGKQLSRTFHFDKVFAPEATQERLFNQAIAPIVDEVLDGFNCTIFAYGQTGTGKTFTMEGGPRNSSDGKDLSAAAGVIPRSIKQIFDTIEANENDSSVKVSFLELYNEELTDLLANDDSKKLRLLEDRSGVVVQGLEEANVKSAAEIYQILDRGTARRRTEETLLNKRSSRSHSIFTVTIHMRETTPEGEDVIKIGKLNLVDLAGSENISRSGARDARAREAGSINQSLLTLGRVITTLVEHSGHVPYRDSKLTRLLRDSLGGRTKTCIIATIAPTVHCQEETISTLDYAHRAKNIRNKPEVNQKISKTTMIKELSTEIERLKQDLIASREKNGIYLSIDRYEHGELEKAHLRDQVTKLKAELEVQCTNYQQQIDSMTASHTQKVQHLNKKATALQQDLTETMDRLTDANITIQERNFVIAAQQRGEQAVACHAADLTQQLGAAAADLVAVFRSFEDTVRVQADDKHALHDIGQLARSRLQALEGAVAQVVQQQVQQCDSLQQQVQQFKAGKQAEVDAINDKAQRIQQSIQALQQVVAEQMNKQTAASEATYNSVLQRNKQGAEQISKAAAEAGDALNCALAALLQSLGTQAKELQLFAQQQQKVTQTSLLMTQQALDKVRSGLSGITSRCGQAAALASQHAGLTGQALQEFAQDFDRTMSLQHTHLVDKINSLLAAFVDERKQVVASVMGKVQRQVVDDSRALGYEMEQVAAAASASMKELQDNEDGLVTRAQDMQATVDDKSHSMHQALVAAGSSTQQLMADVTQYSDQQQQQLAQHVQDIKAIAQKGASSIQAAVLEASEEVSQMAAALNSSSGEMQVNLEAMQQADAQAAHDISSFASQTEVAMEGFGSTQVQGLSELGSGISQVVSQRLSAQPDLTRLPPKRDVPVPPSTVIGSLRCPPVEEVVQRYHSERSAVLQRGGDARQVFEMLTPSKTKRSAAAALPSPGPGSRYGTPRAAAATGGDESSRRLDSTTPGHRAKKSKIPAFGSVTPGNSRLGLVDRTNLE